MKLKKKEKQLPLFWRVFIISVSCALALIIVGASLFALYMSQYENSRPETLISNYIDSLGEDGLAEYIINNFPENTGSFSTVDQVVSEVIMPTLKNSIRYEKRVGEYSDDQPVYTLIAGERKIARISFTPEGKTLFGFNKWGEAELEYEADFSDLHYDALYIKVQEEHRLHLRETDSPPLILKEQKNTAARLQNMKTRSSFRSARYTMPEKVTETPI